MIERITEKFKWYFKLYAASLIFSFFLAYSLNQAKNNKISDSQGFIEMRV